MRWGRSIALLLGCAMMVALRAGHAATPDDRAVPLSPHTPTEHHILVFGDSLSAEYGLPRGTGWVSHLERRLAERKQAYQIRNASISGDTTIGGLQRLPQALEEFRPDLVILQLGANDGLRGLPISNMKDNLREMIRRSQAGGAKVLLVGQHIPPNYGRRYAEEFHEAFEEVANSTGTTLVPFMLDGIATDPDMFLPDGLHPTAQAQEAIEKTIWQYLEPMLE